ncbi:MAG: cation transporter [Eubacterium sp.]|nr:cation transporter [Eubacterium sp.]
MNREKEIIRTSIIGILANVSLAGFKAGVGLIANSIAIVLDAVNNLTDALSSLITIIGTKLAGKKPDKKHPLGHGRIEYLTAMVIALIILYAGMVSLKESITKIIEPQTPDYGVASLVIVSVAIVVKLVLGHYVKSVGKRVQSDALIASGQDARMDAVISTSTLISAIIFLIFQVSLEAWLGILISFFILKTGYDVLSSTLSQILGERIDGELSKEIKQTLVEHPQVQGAYDLILHSYGPNTLIGSVHVEIPDTMRADEIDHLERELQQEVYLKHHVMLTGIGIYSYNTRGDASAQLRESIRDMVMANPYVLQMHGFYINEETKDVRFDLVISFTTPDREQEYCKIVEMLRATYPEYNIAVTLDSDISD